MLEQDKKKVNEHFTELKKIISRYGNSNHSAMFLVLSLPKTSLILTKNIKTSAATSTGVFGSPSSIGDAILKKVKSDPEFKEYVENLLFYVNDNWPDD